MGALQIQTEWPWWTTHRVRILYTRQCEHILHLVAHVRPSKFAVVYFFFNTSMWRGGESKNLESQVRCVSVVVFITHTCNCGTVKPDVSCNAADTYLVESLGYFLPDSTLPVVCQSQIQTQRMRPKCGVEKADIWTIAANIWQPVQIAWETRVTNNNSTTVQHERWHNKGLGLLFLLCVIQVQFFADRDWESFLLIVSGCFVYLFWIFRMSSSHSNSKGCTWIICHYPYISWKMVSKRLYCLLQ